MDVGVVALSLLHLFSASPCDHPRAKSTLQIDLIYANIMFLVQLYHFNPTWMEVGELCRRTK
jgi:hypothetical protein